MESNIVWLSYSIFLFLAANMLSISPFVMPWALPLGAAGGAGWGETWWEGARGF